MADYIENCVTVPTVNNGVFHKLDEIGDNVNIGIRGLLRENKNSSKKIFPPERIETIPLIYL